jgi:hypothetical protein
MRVRLKNSPWMMFALVALLWLAAAVLEGGALYCALAGFSRLPPAGAIAVVALLHLAAPLPVFVISAALSDEDRRKMRAFVHLGALLILFLPVVGVLGVFATFIVGRYVMKTRGFVDEHDDLPSEELPENWFTDESRSLDSLLDEELRVEPILDILAGRDDELKRGAVDFLGRIGSPEAVRLLKRCLSDDVPEVRFYAHSKLEKLDRFHAERIAAAEEAAGESGRNPADLRLLAMAHKRYVDSDLLEEGTARHYLAKARDAFHECLETGGEDPDVLVRLGEVYIELKDYIGAEKTLGKAFVCAPDPAKPLLGLCRIDYEKGDMKGLVERGKELAGLCVNRTGNVDDSILLRFWGAKGTSCE